LLGEDLLVGIESCKQFFLAIFDFSGIGLEFEESSKKKTLSDFLLKRGREKKKRASRDTLFIEDFKSKSSSETTVVKCFCPCGLIY